ncbi:hypothetical protein A0H76_667 [Hepatospora eriocheir]|uniref:Uncharacterized protein n=1 Tax=Hepatospora eriocheir TaxID=1081669 RepID=A0A1X0QCR4_9MICR|nr:hypothetical protein HERIO_615 [Hepatospora eriocheir]ORE00462.1 hypothetical protein A0H76_667 [Hepatospora eriocheir]
MQIFKLTNRDDNNFINSVKKRFSDHKFIILNDKLILLEESILNSDFHEVDTVENEDTDFSEEVDKIPLKSSIKSNMSFIKELSDEFKAFILENPRLYINKYFK